MFTFVCMCVSLISWIHTLFDMWIGANRFDTAITPLHIGNIFVCVCVCFVTAHISSIIEIFDVFQEGCSRDTYFDPIAWPTVYCLPIQTTSRSERWTYLLYDISVSCFFPGKLAIRYYAAFNLLEYKPFDFKRTQYISNRIILENKNPHIRKK